MPQVVVPNTPSTYSNGRSSTIPTVTAPVEVNPIQNNRWNVPVVASSKVDALLSQYLHTQEWSVAFPAPMLNKLMHYIPPCIENAYSVPGASKDATKSTFSGPLAGDTEMLSHGMLEEIPMAHFLMHPERDRALEEVSREVEKREREVTEAHLNVPFRNAKARNPNLPDEDFELVDVDFATPNKSRDLPSLNYLINPVYTEIGFKNAKQRHQDRLSAIMGGSGAIGSTSDGADNEGAGGGGPAPNVVDRATKWKEQLVKTFKNAKALDFSFSSLLIDVAARKMGILLRSETNPSSPDVMESIECVRHFFTIVAFVTSNGTCMGSTKNNTNVDRSFYNTIQGRYVASALWVEVCKIAANTTESSKTNGGYEAPTATAQGLFDAFAAAIKMPSESDDNAALGAAGAATTDGFRGDCAVRSALRKEIIAWAETYTTLITKAIQRATAKGEFISTEHSEHDFTVLNFPAEIAEIERLGDDYTALSNPIQPLLMGTHLEIPALYSQLTSTDTRKSTTGAVPVAVYPLLPHGFENAARPEYTTSAEGETLPTFEAIKQARTHAFGGIEANGKPVNNLRRITLEGEKNGYAIAPYTPSNVRIPHVLLHNPAGRSVDEVTRDHKVYLQPMSYNNEGNQDMTMAATPFAEGSTTSYLSRPISADYEEYYSDGGCTLNYLMQVVPEGGGRSSIEGMESLPTSVQAFVQRGGYATYQRVPAFSRYRRNATSSEKALNSVEKCVTVSWANDDEDAKDQQQQSIGEKRPRDSTADDATSAPLATQGSRKN